MHLEDKIDKLVVDLLKANIIKSCKSPWNSPLVIVPKKDESIRMCLDFRRLNNVTEKFTFPVPDIYTLLDTLRGSVIFSSIDLGQAYYQVELDEASKLKQLLVLKSVNFVSITYRLDYAQLQQLSRTL